MKFYTNINKRVLNLVIILICFYSSNNTIYARDDKNMYWSIAIEPQFNWGSPIGMSNPSFCLFPQLIFHYNKLLIATAYNFSNYSYEDESQSSQKIFTTDIGVQVENRLNSKAYLYAGYQNITATFQNPTIEHRVSDIALGVQGVYRVLRNIGFAMDYDFSFGFRMLPGMLLSIFSPEEGGGLDSPDVYGTIRLYLYFGVSIANRYDILAGTRMNLYKTTNEQYGGNIGTGLRLIYNL